MWEPWLTLSAIICLYVSADAHRPYPRNLASNSAANAKAFLPASTFRKSAEYQEEIGAVGHASHSEEEMKPLIKDDQSADQKKVQHLIDLEAALQESSNGDPLLTKVALQFPVNLSALSRDVRNLVNEFGSPLEWMNGQDAQHGHVFTNWTLLLVAGDFHDIEMDTCPHDDEFLIWNRSHALRDLLQPIYHSLKNVQISTLNPNGLGEYHCDDCPEVEDPCNADLVDSAFADFRPHGWGRFHLQIATNPSAVFELGAIPRAVPKQHEIFLANVAMPHTIWNAGDSPRVHLVIDVQVDGNKDRLGMSSLGREMLRAHRRLEDQARDRRESYMAMYMALNKYACMTGGSTLGGWQSRPLEQAFRKLGPLVRLKPGATPWRRLGIRCPPVSIEDVQFSPKNSSFLQYSTQIAKRIVNGRREFRVRR